MITWTSFLIFVSRSSEDIVHEPLQHFVSGFWASKCPNPPIIPLCLSTLLKLHLLDNRVFHFLQQESDSPLPTFLSIRPSLHFGDGSPRVDHPLCRAFCSLYHHIAKPPAGRRALQHLPTAILLSSNSIQCQSGAIAYIYAKSPLYCDSARATAFQLPGFSLRKEVTFTK